MNLRGLMKKNYITGQLYPQCGNSFLWKSTVFSHLSKILRSELHFLNLKSTIYRLEPLFQRNVSILVFFAAIEPIYIPTRI